jgi:diacylglycerol kinase family enzyme
VHYWQLPEFTIETDKDVHFNLDGEPTLQHKLKFSVLRRHLGVAY